MSRINLSQRIIIESGIYQRLNLTEIAKKIGMSVTAVSNEIKLNRTPAKGSKPHGNDCRFANECEEKNLCCNFDCKRKCVWCFDFNCRELCNKYDNSPCSVLQKSGRKMLVTKRIERDVPISEYFENGKVELVNSSFCGRICNGHGYVGLRLIYKIFSEYQKNGEIPHIVSIHA